MLDKAILSIMCIAVVIVLFVGMIGMMLTMVQKIEFNIVCRSALYEMDLSGGLTDSNRLILYNSLSNSGFSNITINGPAEVQYGEWMNLLVSGSIKSQKFLNLFQKEEEMLYFTYNRKIISRKIHNLAF